VCAWLEWPRRVPLLGGGFRIGVPPHVSIEVRQVDQARAESSRFGRVHYQPVGADVLGFGFGIKTIPSMLSRFGGVLEPGVFSAEADAIEEQEEGPGAAYGQSGLVHDHTMQLRPPIREAPVSDVTVRVRYLLRRFRNLRVSPKTYKPGRKRWYDL
jgi:hypothetical protein